MSHLYANADRITVYALADGKPVSFTWRGQHLTVTEIVSTTRVDLDWWADRHWREYFVVKTNSSPILRLYRDLNTGNWYVVRSLY